ncbi:MAG: alpha-amylase family glycosyl hydrolase, partial [Endomicrobia bacterium]|nr:alpha-amylase family glycosyl hydrolase [Endomicrobiia bacterium]
CNGNKTNDNPVNDPEVADIANYLGGDFAGIIKKIEEGYFQKLGVNTLWISPVVKNPDKAYRDALPPHRKFTGYHGYWPVSLTEVEPRFGTMQDLQRLVQVTHQHGLKVIFDMVLNHVHEENPLYKEKPYWFGQLLLPDGRKNIRLFDERPIDTWFDEFLPSFDYEKNPDAVDFMVDNCIWWIKQTNCDGFRLDAVKHIPHKFWYKLRLKLRQEVEFVNNKKFYLVGETISSREKIMEYINPYELDGQFDFPLYWAIRDVFGYNSAGFTKLEKERMRSEKIFGVSYAIMSVFLGNHDFARFISYADGDIKPTTNEKELAWTAPPKVENKDSYKKAQLAFVFVLTQSAIPLIYYGDEIGLAGAGDPDNRRMMKFENLTKDERKLLEFVSHLLKLRKEHPALRYGIHHTIYVSDEIYVYIKKYFDDEVIVVLNKSKQKQKIEFEIPEWIVIKSRIFKDKTSSKKIELSNGRKLKLLVPALSSVILCSK